MLVEKIKEEGRGLTREVRERTFGYMVAAFGLVAGLAWNEAIKSLIEYLFPLAQNTLLAKFLYAVIITLMVIFVSFYLTRFAGGGKK